MSSFQEYLCDMMDNHVVIRMHHLPTITFDDICMLIHLITTKGTKVALSKEAGYHLCLDEFETSNAICMKAVECEELAILLYLCIDYFNAYNIPVYDDNARYIMSDRFIQAAKKCGIYEYPITRCIIASYSIKYEFNTADGEAYFEQYKKIN